MPPSLEYQWERKFYLAYYCHVPYSDYDNMDVKEIEWHYARLVKQKQDENKATEEANNAVKRSKFKR